MPLMHPNFTVCILGTAYNVFHKHGCTVFCRYFAVGRGGREGSLVHGCGAHLVVAGQAAMILMQRPGRPQPRLCPPPAEMTSHAGSPARPCCRGWHFEQQ